MTQLVTHAHPELFSKRRDWKIIKSQQRKEKKIENFLVFPKERRNYVIATSWNFRDTYYRLEK